MAKLKGQFLVEKRNDLNEMRAIGWTSQELRYLSFYLSKINARDLETRKVKISLPKFAEIMGIERYDVRNIRFARDSLLQKIAVIPFGNCGERAFQLFRKCDIAKNEYGELYIEFEAHDEALPLMFEFKEKYMTYEVANVLQLQGTNHIRMYEILKQYESYNGGVVELSLIELRKRLGVKPDEYAGTQGWKNFKIWVLDKSQKALAQKTDIKFTYEPIRHGRKIGAVKFFIEKNDITYQITLDEYEEENKPLPPQTAPIKSKAAKPPPPKKSAKSADEAKKELEEAKEHELWWCAKELAKDRVNKNKSINATSERYAIGILKKWSEQGYSTLEDLKESGQIEKTMKKSSIDIDRIQKIMETERKKHEND